MSLPEIGAKVLVEGTVKNHGAIWLDDTVADGYLVQFTNGDVTWVRTDNTQELLNNNKQVVHSNITHIVYPG